MIRVSIVEDHAIVRAGLRMLIENQSGMEVVSEAANASQALKTATETQCDIVLLDLDLGQESGLDFLPELLQECAPARVLVLTAAAQSETHLEAVTAGASGIVMKEQAPETLVLAIRRVHAGEAWLGRSLTTAMLAKLSRSHAVKPVVNSEADKIETLTPREKEVVVLITQGLNGARIANQLGISEATVRNHLTSILSKLELANKFELAVFALNHGLK